VTENLEVDNRIFPSTIKAATLLTIIKLLIFLVIFVGLTYF